MINAKDKATFGELIYMRDMAIQGRKHEWASLAQETRDEYHKYACDIEEMLGKLNLEIMIAGEIKASRKLAATKKTEVVAFAKNWVLKNFTIPKNAAALFPADELVKQIFKRFAE